MINGAPSPLRAGVSSFGAGGSNLHLIVEEAPDLTQSEPTAPDAAFLVPLSANSEEQLGRYAASLADFLERYPETAGNDLAFTLQSGRRSMNYRLAVVGSTHAEILSALREVAEGKKKGNNVYSGNSREARSLSRVLEAVEIDTLKKGWEEKGQLDKLAQAWVQGLLKDFTSLASHRRARRISLPTYPFAKLGTG
ncbi:CurL C-terminal domain-containing protein [Veronia nyctiphanis]|nr:ketoacyl-synthetase C-terminal extension domain-containing protein [Veronia nyctiphanis]